MLDLLNPLLLPDVTIRGQETSVLSDIIANYCAYEISYIIEMTMSDSMTGHVLVGFPQSEYKMIPVFVFVKYIVTINGVEYGPFQQFTCKNAATMWHEEPLTEEERNDGVIVKVCVTRFHS